MANTLPALTTAELWPLLPELVLATSAFALLLFDLFFDARNLTGKKAVGDISAVIAAGPASAIYYPVERRAVFGGVRARF